jgi:hypothetical protein
MDADGKDHNPFVHTPTSVARTSHNRPQRLYLCTACQGHRTLVCTKHSEHHVVFIDNTSICPVCATKRSDVLYHTQAERFEHLFKALRKSTRRGDANDFLRKMRNATTPDATPGECLTRAIAAFSLRYHTSLRAAVRFTRRMVPKHRSLFMLLPSADAAKRYHPKP